MGKMDEIIIVAPRDKVFQDEKLAFQGVQTGFQEVADIMKGVANNWTTMRRGDAEENPAYKQPIPYCVLRRGKEIFVYKRLSGGGEARLHDKYSIGAGGHMNEIEGVESFQAIMQVNLGRELDEELDVQSKRQELNPIGLINDDENEVGKVHLGILTVLELDEDASVEVRETDQLQGEWMPARELLEPHIYDKLEPWSQIAAKALA